MMGTRWKVTDVSKVMKLLFDMWPTIEMDATSLFGQSVAPQLGTP